MDYMIVDSHKRIDTSSSPSMIAQCGGPRRVHLLLHLLFYSGSLGCEC